MTLTRRGRLLLRAVPLAVLALTMALGGLFIAIPGSSAEASVLEGTETSEEYIVGYGDTLWTIAGRVAGGQDRQDVITRIGDLNNLTSSDIQVGQLLYLPVFN